MQNTLAWVNLENPVALWWIFLTCVSVVNMLFWGWTWIFFRKDSQWPRQALIWLSFCYVFGCAFRSFLPRADVQRIVLFDSWWSSVFIGRTVATIAELAFVSQWGLVLVLYSAYFNSRPGLIIGRLVVPLIVLAELCSWYAVISTNYLGNSLEESLWTVTYILIGIALFLLSRKIHGPLKWAARASVLGCLVYVTFMITVDVPMYIGRLIQDATTGKVHLGAWEGLVDLNKRWIVTHSIEDWRTEIPWMSLYFSAAVWVSLALCYVPFTNPTTSRNRL